MASKWQQVVDKSALIALVSKPNICVDQSVSWWDEELCQPRKDRRACLVEVRIMTAIEVFTKENVKN